MKMWRTLNSKLLKNIEDRIFQPLACEIYRCGPLSTHCKDTADQVQLYIY